MRQIMTVFAAAALATAATACSNPQSAPEPANEATAAAMPETPDRSDTAADEKAAGMETPTPATVDEVGTGQSGTAEPTAPGY